MAGDDTVSPESMNIEIVQAAAPEGDVMVTPELAAEGDVVVTPELAALSRVHRRVVVLEGESQKAKDQLVDKAKKKLPGVPCQVINSALVWVLLIAALTMAAYAISMSYAIPHYKTNVAGSWTGNSTTVSASATTTTTTTTSHAVTLTMDQLNYVITGTVDSVAVVGMVGWEHQTEAFSGEFSLVGYSNKATYTGYLTGRDVLYLTQTTRAQTQTTLTKMMLLPTSSANNADNDVLEITSILVIVCSVLMIGACFFAIFKAKLNIDDPEKCLYPACTPTCC